MKPVGDECEHYAKPPGSPSSIIVHMRLPYRWGPREEWEYSIGRTLLPDWRGKGEYKAGDRAIELAADESENMNRGGE